MNRISCCTLVLVAVGTALAAPDTDQLGKELLAVFQESRDVLKTIKDKETARAALPKLKTLGERQQKVMKALDGLSKKEAAALEKKHRPAVEPVWKELDKEFVRVEALPGVSAILKATPLFEERRRQKEKIALVGVKNLETAVTAYKLNNRGNFPANLTVLTQKQGGKAAYLEPRDLKDPWGRPYVYDPATLSPTGKPLIYSQGADPKDPRSRISNFVPPKKPSKK